MSAVNVTNVTVLDNPSMFLNPFQFEISYECLVALKDGNGLFLLRSEFSCFVSFSIGGVCIFEVGFWWVCIDFAICERVIFLEVVVAVQI
jgi:hypothetical protein